MTEYNEVEVKKDITTDDEVKEVQDAKKEVKAVAHAKPVKKGLVERLVSSFIGPDGIKDVSHYVSHEIISPAIKNVVADAIKGGVDGLLYGRDGVNRGGYNPGRSHYGTNNRTNYQSRSQYSRGPVSQPQQRARRPRFTTESYMLESRDEAMYVFDELRNLANDYNFVSIADFKDLVGIDSEYTDNNYGWMIEQVEGGSIRSMRNGFVVVLPQPTVL